MTDESARSFQVITTDESIVDLSISIFSVTAAKRVGVIARRERKPLCRWSARPTCPQGHPEAYRMLATRSPG